MPDNIVTLPLSPTDMVEFFKDKTQQYVVDLDETIKVMDEKSILLYLANLGIKCAFTKVTDQLVAEYMIMKDVTDIPMLVGIHANIMGYVKYQTIFYPLFEELFSAEDIIDFAQNHTDLVAEQCVFLDSFLLYATTRSNEEHDSSPITDDQLHDTLGFSVLSLLTFEDFMIMYSQDVPPLLEQTYYTRYFDEYMFRGKNLFHYAHQSPLFGLVAVIQSRTEAGNVEVT